MNKRESYNNYINLIYDNIDTINKIFKNDIFFYKWYYISNKEFILLIKKNTSPWVRSCGMAAEEDGVAGIHEAEDEVVKNKWIDFFLNV